MSAKPARAMLAVRFADGTQVFANTSEAAILLLTHLKPLTPVSITQAAPSPAKIVAASPDESSIASPPIADVTGTLAIASNPEVFLVGPGSPPRPTPPPGTVVRGADGYSGSGDTASGWSHDPCENMNEPVADETLPDSKTNGDTEGSQPFDAKLLKQGDRVQWRNYYNQWQNAEVICHLTNGNLSILEDKNGKTTPCGLERVRPRFDADGFQFEQEF